MRRLAPGRLVVATHNAGKLREVAALLAPYAVEPVSAAALGLPAPAETGSSFAENATIKAQAAAAAGLPALADDSGFSVEALAGAPGVYTADWAEAPDGSRDYAIGMRKVHALAGHASDRRARFTAVLVLAWPDGHSEVAEGVTEGEWVWPPRGGMGFGFDPIFVPEGGAETFAELSPERKMAVNHRARAFARLAPLLPRRG